MKEPLAYRASGSSKLCEDAVPTTVMAAQPL